MDLDKYLYQIFKTAHPEDTDEQIQAKIAGTGEASDQAKQDMQALLAPNVSSPSSSFDVQTSDTTTPMSGNIPTDNSAVPVQITKGLDVPPLSSQLQDNILNQTEQPSASINETKAPIPVSTPPVVPTPSKMPIEASSTPVSSPTTSSDEDNRKRNAMLAAEEHKRKMALIPEAIAGAGDAIASGAKAFGVNNTTDVQSKIAENAQKNVAEDKANFELKLKNDPTSDVSKAYRQMVLQIAPEMAKQPAFNNMSAQAIGDKLPLIDTMMKAQAQKDAKEMSLKQLQAGKDISLGLRQDQQQDKLEQQYKQQLMSVRGDPNISALEKQRDAAAQAYNLIKDSETKGGGYNLSEPQLVELYGQLYTAMTGRGLTAEAQRAMDQATAQKKYAAVATFMGMSPSATPQAIGDRLKHMTTTLGTQVQENLNKRMESRILPPSSLDPDRAKTVKEAGRGYTFQELMEQSNKRKAAAMSPTGTNTTKSGISYSVE